MAMLTRIANSAGRRTLHRASGLHGERAEKPNGPAAAAAVKWEEVSSDKKKFVKKKTLRKYVYL